LKRIGCSIVVINQRQERSIDKAPSLAFDSVARLSFGWGRVCLIMKCVAEARKCLRITTGCFPNAGNVLPVE
jgi:hypothetical protein